MYGAKRSNKYEIKKDLVNDITILVVDDSPASSELVSEIVNHLGHVVVAGSGEKAIKICQHMSVDIILLDINMPNMSGYEAAVEIKSGRNNKDTLIIFVSGEERLESEFTAISSGGIDFIQKPFDAYVLKGKIEAHIKNIRLNKSLLVETQSLQRMMRKLPAFISYWSEDWSCAYVNDLDAKWFGRRPHEMLSGTLKEILGEVVSQEIEYHFDEPIKQNQEYNKDILLHIYPGREIYVNISIIREKLFSRYDGYLLVLSNIDLRKRRELQYLEQKEKSDGALNAMGSGVISTCTEGRITFMNPASQVLLGISLLDCIGQPIENVMCIQDPYTSDIIENPIRGTLFEKDNFIMPFDMVLIGSKGISHDIEATSSPILDDSGNMTGAVMVFYDVTESRQESARKVKEANYDDLTGLPNRSLMVDRVEQLIKRASRTLEKFAIIVVDINDFEIVNNMHGHIVGDQILIELGASITEIMRECDVLCRCGGDDFAIIMSGVNDPNEVAKFCERIAITSNRSFSTNGVSVDVHVSIGAAVYPQDGGDFHTLYKRSDSAMRESKRSGSGKEYNFFSPALETQIREKFEKKERLSKAIENKELVNYYQPKFDSKSGKIIGFEALVRWVSEGEVVAYPDEFISLAEETGLIIALGDNVMESACQQIKIWHQTHPHLTMAVNISAKQFSDSLERKIKKVIKESGVPKENLELEMTESIMVNGKDAQSIFDDIKNIGVHIAMDDFGTGYSSLSYIRDLPIDTLKIDQAFVRAMLDDHVSLSICRTIVDLAKNLNLGLVAEGVETKEHVDALKKMGCYVHQGYFYSKPVCASEIDKLMEKMG